MAGKGHKKRDADVRPNPSSYGRPRWSAAQEFAHANIPPFQAPCLKIFWLLIVLIRAFPNRTAVSDIIRIRPSYSGGAAPDFHRLPFRRSSVFDLRVL